MKTRNKIIIGIVIAVGLVTTVLSVETYLGQLEYKEKVGGLKDFTSISISDPLCLTAIATSGEKGGAVSLEQCIPLKQLNEIGCTYQILEHISQYTNALDENFDGILLREWIGFPEGVNEEDYDACLEFLLKERQTGNVSTFNYEIKTGDVIYGNQYEITGGVVDEITHNADSNSLIILLQESGKGHIQIVIPSGLFAPINKAPLVDYFVIQDGEEMPFEQLSPIMLKIPFEKDTKKIEIIGVILPSLEQSFQVTKILDYCKKKETGIAMHQPGLQYSNKTHYIDNNSCKWIHLEKYLDENNELNFGLQYDKNGMVIDDLQRIHDWCNYHGEKPQDWYFDWNNQTHHIDSKNCEWIENEN